MKKNGLCACEHGKDEYSGVWYESGSAEGSLERTQFFALYKASLVVNARCGNGGGGSQEMQWYQ